MPFFLDISGDLHELSTTSPVCTQVVAKRYWRCQVIITDDDAQTGSCLSIPSENDFFENNVFCKEKDTNESTLLFEVKTKNGGIPEGTYEVPFHWDGCLIGTIQMEVIVPASIALPGHLKKFEGLKKRKKGEYLTPEPLEEKVQKQEWTRFWIRHLSATVIIFLFIVLGCAGAGIYSWIKLTNMAIEEIHLFLSKK